MWPPCCHLETDNAAFDIYTYPHIFMFNATYIFMGVFLYLFLHFFIFVDLFLYFIKHIEKFKRKYGLYAIQKHTMLLLILILIHIFMFNATYIFMGVSSSSLKSTFLHFSIFSSIYFVLNILKSSNGNVAALLPFRM